MIQLLQKIREAQREASRNSATVKYCRRIDAILEQVYDLPAEGEVLFNKLQSDKIFPTTVRIDGLAPEIGLEN